MSTTKPPGDKHFYRLLLLCAVCSVATIAAISASFKKPGAAITLEEIFAGLNVAIAACAFVGLIVTIRQQHHEIQQTQEELRGQKEQLEKQANVLDLQQFEGTFFNLVRLHHQIVEGMSDEDVREEIRGRAVLVHAENQTLGAANPHRLTRVGDRAQPVTSAELIKAYHYTYRDKGAHLGHYFRNFYHIVKFVDGSRLPDLEKRRYISFARAQLSHPETVLMFFNGFSSLGEKMKPFIEKYALLEHMPDRLALRANLRLYSRSAYGTNEDLLQLFDEAPDETSRSVRSSD